MNQYLKSSVKVLALGAIFGTLPAFAESVIVDQVAADGDTGLKGFTVGADIVYSHADAKHEQMKADLRDMIGRNGYDNKYDPLNHKRCCIDPSVNIGYTHIYNGWYMGASGEASFGANSEKNSDFGGGTKVDTEIGRASYGLKLKGGYFIKDLKSARKNADISGMSWQWKRNEKDSKRRRSQLQNRGQREEQSPAPARLGL